LLGVAGSTRTATKADCSLLAGGASTPFLRSATIES
jgi:hypothetical protein